MTGFTVEGSWPSDVCYGSIYGVAVLGDANLVMSNSTVENIGGDPLSDGCQGGVGIEVGLATSATTADPGSATLTNDVVSNYQKNGITVDGAGSAATISGATVNGAGPSQAIAQNGIQVSDGAGGKITGSFVTGDECDDTAGGCGPNGFTQVQSAGILLFDAGATIVSTTKVTNSDIGVYAIQDYAWAYYTPPSPFTAVTEKFSGLVVSPASSRPVEGVLPLGSKSLPISSARMEADDGCEGRWQAGRGLRRGSAGAGADRAGSEL